MSSKNRLYIRKIISVQHLTNEGAYLFSFKRDEDFIPGQVMAITTDKTIPARLYSIASGNYEGEIKILFDVVPGGVLSKKLSQLKPGDEVLASEPFGHFTGDQEPAYWIAAGTGVAPFAAMFYSGLSQNKVLIHGGCTLDSFYFQEDFSVMKERYIRCCTREKGEKVYEGRLTNYLRSLDNLPTNYKYYLCGSSEMIVETRSILMAKGVPFDKIIAEIYF